MDLSPIGIAVISKKRVFPISNTRTMDPVYKDYRRYSENRISMGMQWKRKLTEY